MDTVITAGDSIGLGIEAAVYLAERDSRADATMSDLGRGAELLTEAGRRRVDPGVLRLDAIGAASIDQAVATPGDRPTSDARRRVNRIRPGTDRRRWRAR